MARIRQIKPEFCDDDELAETCSRDARFFFCCSWMFADKAGRMRDSPRWLKNKIFPFDSDITAETVDGFLDELSAGEYIERYEVDGKRYIQIRTFHLHQRVHPNEPNSKIPAPPPKVEVKPLVLVEQKKSIEVGEGERERVFHDSHDSHSREKKCFGLPSPSLQNPLSRTQNQKPAQLEISNRTESFQAAIEWRDANHARDPACELGLLSATEIKAWAPAMLTLLSRGRSRDEIRTVIGQCQREDYFWTGKIEKPAQLVKHFDGILRDAQRAPPRKKSDVSERIARIAEEMERAEVCNGNGNKHRTETA